MAESKGFSLIAWEGEVGGRFSAFTVAHTAFLKMVGLDTESFLSGKADMDKRCEGEDSPAKILAKNIFDNYKRGLEIIDFFFFNSELESLGKWCRQLIAESLSVLTPTVSLGPTDLHSMLELYLGGPRDRFTLFVRSIEEIKGGVNEKAYGDVALAYEKASLPFEKYGASRKNFAIASQNPNNEAYMPYMMARYTGKVSSFLDYIAKQKKENEFPTSFIDSLLKEIDK
jgi:glucose-6-phosphate isomerase